MAIFFPPHPAKYTNLVKKTYARESGCGDVEEWNSEKWQKK